MQANTNVIYCVCFTAQTRRPSLSSSRERTTPVELSRSHATHSPRRALSPTAATPSLAFVGGGAAASQAWDAWDASSRRIGALSGQVLLCSSARYHVLQCTVCVKERQTRSLLVYVPPVRQPKIQRVRMGKRSYVLVAVLLCAAAVPATPAAPDGAAPRLRSRPPSPAPLLTIYIDASHDNARRRLPCPGAGKCGGSSPPPPGPAEARLRVHVEQVAMLYAAALPQNLDNIRLKIRGQWRPSLPTVTQIRNVRPCRL